MVVKDGQICHYMFYVCKGLLRQFYFKNGREITEHFTCEGNIAYCIESIFKNKPSHLMMEALENSELCLIPYAGLVELSLLYKGITTDIINSTYYGIISSSNSPFSVKSIVLRNMPNSINGST